jgi:hypothetical protein
MAVGFPTKVSYANGDVYSASDVNDTNGTLNLLNPTAKGSIVSASSANTPSRLAVGTDGQVLVADSTQTTGLAWATASSGAPYVAGKNVFINGAADVWQRGTSFTTSGAYTADRWAEVNGANSITYSRSTDVPSSLGFQYSISRAGTGSNMVQRIEAANAARFAGQTVTLSFYYKSTAGADSLGYSIYHANSADNFGGVTQIGSNQTIATPSTSWTRVTYSFAVPAGGANGLAFYFFRGNTATSTTLMTGFQIELGSSASAFSRAGGTIQGELANCQRYYIRYSYNSTNTQYFGSGIGFSTTRVFASLALPVSMRTTPSISLGGNVFVGDTNTNTQITSSGVNAGDSSGQQLSLSLLVSSGLTQFRPYFIALTASGSLVELSSEL